MRYITALPGSMEAQIIIYPQIQWLQITLGFFFHSFFFFLPCFWAFGTQIVMHVYLFCLMFVLLAASILHETWKLDKQVLLELHIK